MILLWTPKEGFEGNVSIEIPSMRERLILAKELAFDGKTEVNGRDNIDKMLKLLEITAKYVKKVNLKHKEGKEFTSWEEMQNDSLCDKIVEEISSFVVSGGKLGEV